MLRVLSAPVRKALSACILLPAARKITVSADGTGIVSQAGGLSADPDAAGRRAWTGAWRRRWSGGGRPRAVHSPGKIITDLAVAVALGGDCLADIAVLRAQPELFGPVASDPVVSRLVARLAADAPRALKAIRAARAAARRAGLGAGRGCRAGRGRRRWSRSTSTPRS